MSVPTSTLQTYTQTSIREDLINAIYNVDPYKTPLLNMAKKAKAEQTKHEWTTDALAAQNTANAQIEGDDASADAVVATTRLNNYTQISRKTVEISGTTQAVTAAGGSNKMGYQLLKSSKALKRDIEGILTLNQASAVGAGSTARKLGGLPAYLITNTVFQTGGTPSGANPSDGTGGHTRTYNSVTTALTETMVESLAQLMFKNSGESPQYFLLSPVNKQAVSKFTGVAGTRFNKVEDKTLRNAIDEYETDFGMIKMVPDIFLGQSGDVYAIEPEYVRVAYLRPFQTVPLAKTGDADRKLLLVEYTLEVGNEKAVGAIFDTTG